LSHPFFTVYVPFHSPAYAEAAQRALESLEAQFFQSFEVIVVVNGTHIPFWANPVSFLSDTRAAFGRRLISGRFHTLAAASNAALDVARGEWFMRLDADDAVKPDALAEYVRVIDRAKRDFPDAAFVVAGHWDDTGELYGSGLAIPAWWLRSQGGYDPDLPLGDGRHLRSQLEKQFGEEAKRRLPRTSYPVYEYRRHLSSMSHPPEPEEK